MILARIEFKPEHASAFIDSEGSSRNIIEQAFSSVEELIEVLQGFEPFIKDCTAMVDGKILQLSDFKTK